ncbi:MAG: hypothetical protein CSA20_03960 [Deltaproteobacteria bacterium]|nr:MAG: hypothetical protein CSB23_01360 [Deltaproteobacteria bacterium]PIE73247.1 MAG: hypothetical protein CSA20_03960 [Deltaproteobacteria bacterium]
MKDIQRKLSGFSLVLMLVLTSCSSAPVNTQETQPELRSLNCIAVLPAVTSAVKDDTLRYNQARTLERGASQATVLLLKKLSGNSKVRLVNVVEMASFAENPRRGEIGILSTIGEAVNCDGILSTTIRTYKQRQGTKMAVESPASVDFTMVLREVPTGHILWSSEFRETQQPLLDNLFSFGKQQTKGIYWLTAEELLQQGIENRLDNCPYLVTP